MNKELDGISVLILEYVVAAVDNRAFHVERDEVQLYVSIKSRLGGRVALAKQAQHNAYLRPQLQIKSVTILKIHTITQYK